MTSFDFARFHQLLDDSDVLRSVHEVVATYQAQRVLPDDGGEESVIIEVLHDGEGNYMTTVHSAKDPRRRCSSENATPDLGYAVANIHWEKMNWPR